MVIVGLCIYLLERATRPASKYTNLGKRAGLATSQQKPQISPKSLRGKLSNETIPLQSSDQPAKQNAKKVAANNKYRKLYSKKGL